MASREDITAANALMAPSMADALQAGYDAAMMAQADLMALNREMPEDTLPVKLTAVDGSGLYSWTLQYKDTTNTRADHPNGRTGTPTKNPAYFPSGSITSFPFECWIRRFGFDGTKGGALYEVVSAGPSGTTGALTYTYFGINQGYVTSAPYPGTSMGYFTLGPGNYQLFFNMYVSCVVPAPVNCNLLLTPYYVSGTYQLYGPPTRSCWVPPGSGYGQQNSTHHWELQVVSTATLSIVLQAVGATFFVYGEDVQTGGNDNKSQIAAYQYA